MTEPLILDWCHPTHAFGPLVGTPGAHLFHGGEGQPAARWSFIVAAPAQAVTLEKGQVFIDGTKTSTSFVEVLRAFQQTHKARGEDAGTMTSNAKSPYDLPPFTHGLAGYLGYEAATLFEPSLTLPSSPFDLPDGCFGRYEAVAAFDRQEKRLLINGVSRLAIDKLAERLNLGTDEPQWGHRDLAPRTSSPDGPFALTNDQCNFSRSAFMAIVDATKEAIVRGDVFQANITRQIAMQARAASDDAYQAAFDVYCRTVANTDAAHAAFLQFSPGVILSNSPERFFRIQPGQDGQLHVLVEPIKGTIARGKTPGEDRALADQLQASQKERAENIMIADLLRNDLSRVCTPASVREDDICAILSLTYVHHLVSRISGTLRPELDSLDALGALFPCGSITGAPKVEAMGVIAAQEQVGRGPYCGAIGYVNHDGASDFSVAIRTMMIDQIESNRPCRLTIPVGGGITLNSDPVAEYEETVLKALGLSGGLLYDQTNSPYDGGNVHPPEGQPGRSV